jgi:hypothetical protein
MDRPAGAAGFVNARAQLRKGQGGGRPVAPQQMKSPQTFVVVVLGCEQRGDDLARKRRRERLWRAARKLRARLGEASSHVDPIPERPYGMWQRTYGRLARRLVALEAAALDTANMELRKHIARRRWFFEKG